MKTQIKNLFAAMAVTCVFATAGFAQEIVIEQPIETTAPNQTYVVPVRPSQNQFYYGMSVELRRNRLGGTTLRIVSVTPGSPAQQAGLEFGDEIRRVNGQNFDNATDSFDAVRKLNQWTSFQGAPIRIFAATNSVVSPEIRPYAGMIVRNVRDGQDVRVDVYPTKLAIEAPAAPATVIVGQ